MKAGVFDGWKGSLLIGGWYSLFLVGFGAVLLLHLSSAFLIPLAALMFDLIIVAALQWKAERRQIP